MKSSCKQITQLFLSLVCRTNITGTNTTVSPEDDSDEIMDLAVDIAILMSILTAIAFVIATYHIAIFSLIGDRQARKVRKLAFQNVLRQDIAYFDKHMGGELNTRLAE